MYITEDYIQSDTRMINMSMLSPSQQSHTMAFVSSSLRSLQEKKKSDLL